MSERFETEADWNRGALRPGDAPNSLEFGPEFGRLAAESRARREGRGLLTGVGAMLGGGASQQHSATLPGGAVGGAVGATIQLRQLARGWLLSDGKGWDAACETTATALEALGGWLVEIEGRPRSGVSPRGGAVEVGPRPYGHCLCARRLGNGWLVTDFMALEMLALDAGAVREIASQWMIGPEGRSHG